MSTISVSNITTANGTENLTISTGNTSGGSEILVKTDGSMNVLINSTFTAVSVNTVGGVVVSSNLSANILSIPTVLGGLFSGNTVLVKETIYVANGTHTKGILRGCRRRWWRRNRYCCCSRIIWRSRWRRRWSCN
jgi:hypothetical protein